ncbi:hypothetical protein F4U94_22790 [Sphingobium limneticum]|uniref:hypothetical protein n=1 Tax=Sphingobium limneticum TaxID=1007511 RepID=UPI00123DA836|nr:hypothetical protein [Sphingobium limneticum]KAA9009654.1 hypothetical protein F4U94_22790 [Sphingobium limneticum]
MTDGDIWDWGNEGEPASLNKPVDERKRRLIELQRRLDEANAYFDILELEIDQFEADWVSRLASIKSPNDTPVIYIGTPPTTTNKRIMGMFGTIPEKQNLYHWSDFKGLQDVSRYRKLKLSNLVIARLTKKQAMKAKLVDELYGGRLINDPTGDIWTSISLLQQAQSTKLLPYSNLNYDAVAYIVQMKNDGKAFKTVTADMIVQKTRDNITKNKAQNATYIEAPIAELMAEVAKDVENQLLQTGGTKA